MDVSALTILKYYLFIMMDDDAIIIMAFSHKIILVSVYHPNVKLNSNR